jgi:hypothetical protein
LLVWIFILLRHGSAYQKRLEPSHTYDAIIRR